MQPRTTAGGRYTFSGEHNPFLSAISVRLLKQSPKVLHDHLTRESVDFGRRAVEIWFKTAGCRYFLRGGCSMCNYGYSNKVAPDTMIGAVTEAVTQAGIGPDDQLVISPSGSLLDPGEVPDAVYAHIMSLVRDSGCYSFNSENQAVYVTDEAMKRYRAELPDQRLHVTSAIESADPWIRRNVLNKDLPTSLFLSALAAAHEQGVLFGTNILLGTPFLSEREAIDDTIRSARWALSQGVDEICVFPVHVKIGTLTHWMWQRGLFRPPSLWSLVKVLAAFEESDLQHITIAWHKTYYVDAADIRLKSRRIPYTCDACYSSVVDTLDEYVATRSRMRLVALENTE